MVDTLWVEFIIELNHYLKESVLPTSVAIGFSQQLDVQKAALQACLQIKNQLFRLDTDFMMVFSSPEYATKEVLEVIGKTLRPKRLIGSTTGRILLAQGATNRGIALLAINSDEIIFGISAIDGLDNLDIHNLGFDLARLSSYDLNLTHREIFFALSQGIEKSCSSFIRGAKESLGSAFPMVGAISSDDLVYNNLAQFYQDQILHQSAIGTLIGGSFHLGIGLTHGFKPLGKPRTVTKVEDYIIRTIDHKPAVDLYKHFMGDDAKNLKGNVMNTHAALYPLGVYIEESRHYLLRNIIDILEDGSIVCPEGILEGSEVHLMISNKEACILSAIEAARLAKASLAERPPKLILIFESLARHKILGNTAYNEIQVIRDTLGASVPMIGMCTYGEIGPFGNIKSVKHTYLHNESILVMAFA